MKNRKIAFKLNISLLQQTCEFRGSTVGIFSRDKDSFSGAKSGCKIKILVIADWIGLRALSLDKSLRSQASIGQARLHHCGHWSTTWTSTAFAFPSSVSICLQCQATTSSTTTWATTTTWPKTFTLLIYLNKGQTARLHNMLYITSLVSSHDLFDHGSPKDAEVWWQQL